MHASQPFPSLICRKQPRAFGYRRYADDGTIADGCTSSPYLLALRRGMRVCEQHQDRPGWVATPASAARLAHHARSAIQPIRRRCRPASVRTMARITDRIRNSDLKCLCLGYAQQADGTAAQGRQDLRPRYARLPGREKYPASATRSRAAKFMSCVSIKERTSARSSCIR
jgi:hypothetical protein